MSITKQYRLPSCGLVLEGFSNDTSVSTSEGRPILSILTNAECTFPSHQQRINGGRELLENLVKAVSAYCQTFLSGLPHPQPPTNGAEWVSLQAAEKGLHRLSWFVESQKQEMQITTLELFDLLETLDQFQNDTSTLPELKIELQPVSKRYRQSEQSFADRATPAGLGLGTVAAAVIALSWIPAPPPRPVETAPQSTPNQSVPANPTTPTNPTTP